MEVRFTKNHFETPQNIIWDDVIKKISYECLNKTHKLIINKSMYIDENDLSYIFVESPTIVLHENFFPGTIKNSFDELELKAAIKDVHFYISFAKDSGTFGRHNDIEDVLIVQSIGTTSYKFDDEMIYDLNPGDSLFIPKGVYHDPIIRGPRVTLSCSW